MRQWLTRMKRCKFSEKFIIIVDSPSLVDVALSGPRFGTFCAFGVWILVPESKLHRRETPPVPISVFLTVFAENQIHI